MPLPEPEPPPLVAELINRGVTKATAAELVQRHPAELIQAKIDVFDWLMEKQDKRVAKSPAGYLVKSIIKDYAAPKGFIVAPSGSSEEARQARERQDAEDRRRQQEQEARDQAMRKRVNAYIKQLDQAERIALEAEALATASLENRESYHSHIMARFRDTLMLAMLRDLIAKKLEQEQLAEA